MTFIEIDIISIRELAKLLYASDATVYQLIKKGKLKTGVFSVNGSLCASRSAVPKIKQELGLPEDFNPNNYFTIQELSTLFEVNENTPNKWIRKGIISNFILWMGHNYVPKTELEKLKKELGYNNDYDPDKHISLDRMAEIISLPSVTSKSLSKWISRGTITEYITHLGKYYLTEESVRMITFGVPDDYITVEEAATRLTVNTKLIRQYVRGGKLKADSLRDGISNNRKKLFIQKDSIDIFERDYLTIESLRKDPTNFTIRETSTRLKLHLQTVQRFIRIGVFPHAFKVNNMYLVPAHDIIQYERKAEQLSEEKNKPYSKTDAIQETIQKINDTPIPTYLHKTKQYFVNYCEIQIKKARGNEFRPKTLMYELCSTFNIVIANLPNNVEKLSDENRDAIIKNDLIPTTSRKRFLHFYRHCSGFLDMASNTNIFISKNDKVEVDKDIYSPELYEKYITHVKNVKMHIPNAIKGKSYCHMWLYTTMLLTDSWRPTDIVTQLPHIDIEEIGVDKFDWLQKNILSRPQCQKVINQVYLKTKNLEVGKTEALLNFVVQPDMVECMANALVISELHRRINKDKVLLRTLLVGRPPRLTSPSEKHLAFFNRCPELKEFSPSKMNNSTMTYFFYSTVEEGGENAEFAIELLQRMRSHESMSTTAVYVSLTNKDGSINRVSLNLFKRGHFGWLYNYLISSVFEKYNISNSLEERTKIIQEVRGEMTPIEIENWSMYFASNVLEKFSTRKSIDSKKTKEPFPKTLEDWVLYAKRNIKKKKSIVLELAKMPEEMLITILKKVFRGELPAKTEHGQCLVYPECKRTKLTSCFSCEYFIPQSFVLFEAVNEFRRLTNSIKNSKYDAIIVRDSEFVKNIIILFQEAVDAFGYEYVQGFITRKEINDSIFDVAEKLHLE